MANLYWIGGATAVPQVDTFTPGGTITTGDVNTLTVKDENNTTLFTITFTTAGTTTAAAVSAGLIAAWNASTRAAAMAAATGTSTAILTAATSGVPFYVTSSVTGVGTLTRAATTASAGPNDWNTATNWSTAAVPVNSDNVTIDSRGSSNSILYGLNQSAVTLALLEHYFGAPAVGTTSYALMISATIGKSFLPATDGSTRSGNLFNVNTGSNATTWSNYGSGTAAAAGISPFTIAGSHASNVLNIYGGTCGVGLLSPGQASSFPTLNIESGSVTLGRGVTCPTTATNGGGSLIINTAGTGSTLVTSAGKSTVNGTTKMGTVTCTGGNTIYNVRISGDDVGTLNMDGGELDLSGDASLINATTLNIKRGGSITLFSATQLSATATTFDSTYGLGLQMKLAA